MSAVVSPAERRERAFQTPKTYGLMALTRGRGPVVNRGPEDTVMTWPRVIIAELTVLMGVLALMLILSILFDAPLKEIANPAVPENPAKAPWYFLGLQELVGYSALMGGVVIPGIVLIGLALIPYLDREKGHVGIWFSSAMGKRIALETAIFSFLINAGMVAFTVELGWIRNWFPDVHQLVVIAINPGTLITGAVIVWSLWIIRRTGSRRMGAISVFTFFVVAFAVLTYVATFLRGPNWGFYWSQAQWPGIH